MLSTFGKRLRVLREEAGLTQGELRDLVKKRYGVSVGISYISEIERNDRTPTVSIAAALARALDTSLDYLAMLSDDPTPAHKRSVPEPSYFSPEADEAANLLDLLPQEQRSDVLSLLRSLAVASATPQRQQAVASVMLDVISQEFGPQARAQIARALVERRLATNGQ